MQPTSASRFARPSAAPTTSSNTVPARPSAALADDDLTQRYKTLKAQGDALEQRRSRRQFELDQAEQIVLQCQQQGLDEFKVNSLEELNAAIAQRYEDDKSDLDQYEAEIEKETELQRSLDEKLSVLDRPAQG